MQRTRIWAVFDEANPTHQRWPLGNEGMQVLFKGDTHFMRRVPRVATATLGAGAGGGAPLASSLFIQEPGTSDHELGQLVGDNGARPSRATHAHPTSPHSTGFCAIWDCISSSSSQA